MDDLYAETLPSKLRALQCLEGHRGQSCSFKIR